MLPIPVYKDLARAIQGRRADAASTDVIAAISWWIHSHSELMVEEQFSNYSFDMIGGVAGQIKSYAPRQLGDQAVDRIKTYVVGTTKCAELLAAHGLLNYEAALILAKALRQQAAVSPEMYPNRSFAEASDAISHADLLERCAEVSVKVSADQQELARVDHFVRALERIFEDCGVPVGDGPLFPVVSV